MGEGALAQDVAVFILELIVFDHLLGVVPGAAAVVHEGGHHDAGDGADHQHCGHDHGGVITARSRYLKTTPMTIGASTGSRPGAIISLRPARAVISTLSGIVRLGCPGHDARDARGTGGGLPR